MATDTTEPAASGGPGRSGTAVLEAGAERDRTLDRLEARMQALQLALRTRRTSPHFELWRHDLRKTRETWFRLVDPDGRDHPMREGS